MFDWCLWKTPIRCLKHSHLRLSQSQHNKKSSRRVFKSIKYRKFMFLFELTAVENEKHVIDVVLSRNFNFSLNFHLLFCTWMFVSSFPNTHQSLTEWIDCALFELFFRTIWISHNCGLGSTWNHLTINQFAFILLASTAPHSLTTILYWGPRMTKDSVILN